MVDDAISVLRAGQWIPCPPCTRARNLLLPCLLHHALTGLDRLERQRSLADSRTNQRLFPQRMYCYADSDNRSRDQSPWCSGDAIL